MVIDWLKEASTSAVARLMGLSWNAIDGIMQRAVKRGLARRKKTCAQHLGVDETAFRKRHDYVSIVSDQDNGTVLYVGKDRKKADLKQWFEALPRSCLEAIESVSMDMWPAFINATLEMVPGAESKIAFDKFHVAKYLGEAVDKVRREEHRKLMKAGKADLRAKGFTSMSMRTSDAVAISIVICAARSHAGSAMAITTGEGRSGNGCPSMNGRRWSRRAAALVIGKRTR